MADSLSLSAEWWTSSGEGEATEAGGGGQASASDTAVRNQHRELLERLRPHVELEAGVAADGIPALDEPLSFFEAEIANSRAVTKFYSSPEAEWREIKTLKTKVGSFVLERLDKPPANARCPDKVAFRISGEMVGTPAEIFSSLMDYEHRFEWDQAVDERSRIVTFFEESGMHWITHSRTKSNLLGLIAARDFFDFVTLNVDENTGAIWSHSFPVEHEAYAETIDDCVRGHNGVCTFSLRPIDPTDDGLPLVHADYVVLSAPKGSLPNWLVMKALNSVIPDILNRLQEYTVQRYYPDADL